MKLHISDKIASMPTSIFTSISKMAIENNAINLGQGFPNFDGPEWIKDELYKASKEGKNQYAPSIGIYSLRKEISEYHKKYYDLDWDIETEITITAGATEALFSTFMALINPGDSYKSVVQLAGGICRYVTLKKPDFSFDLDEFLSSINKKTKLIVLNTPHNPTGKVFNLDELKLISEVAIKNDIIVLSDEVYEFLTFDNIKHIPIASLELLLFQVLGKHSQ